MRIHASPAGFVLSVLVVCVSLQASADNVTSSCGIGFILDGATGNCLDVDECAVNEELPCDVSPPR
eukprot:1909915-Rhodomonas_salina.2